MKIKIITVLFMFIASCAFIHAQESSLVYPGADGKLVYVPHANTQESNADNIIPDFSRCGYMAGGVAIPDVPVKITLSPQAGDDRQRIQDAIDYVGGLTPDANGFRGAVLLTAGTYTVDNGIPSYGDALKIKKDGVVLRGEGQGLNGTIIQTTHESKHQIINITSSNDPDFSSSNMQMISDSYVGFGATSFNVDTASYYSVGDKIWVASTVNDTWLDDIYANNYLNSGDTYWTSAGYKINFERTITAINGNQITIDSPIMQPMQTRYGGGHIKKIEISSGYRIQQAGVENLRLQGVGVTASSAASSSNRLKTGVKLTDAENCWVRDVTVLHASYAAVDFWNSHYNTVQDIASLTPLGPKSGGYRYTFDIGGKSSHNLIQRTYCEDGRHDYVTGQKTPGPNVFLDGYSIIGGTSGPHQRWAIGTLYDNLSLKSDLALEHRGTSGTGHGWAGAQSVLWNNEMNKIICDAPDGFMNYAIGNIGTETLSVYENNNKAGVYRGFYDSHGTHVATRSLYLKQLEDRLGSAAVDNITVPLQLTGNIYSLISSWAGEGAFPVAIAPTDLAIAGDSLSWTDVATDETGYVVERSDDKGITFTQVASLSANTELYVETEDLLGDTRYRVKSVHSTGFSAYTSPVRIIYDGDNAVTYSVDEDAFTRGGTYDNTNYGSDTSLVTKNSDGLVDNDRKTLVKFDLSQEGLSSADVLQATLRVYVESVDNNGLTISAKSCNDDWDEATVTWASGPGGGPVFEELLIDFDGQYATFDVTDYVKTELSADSVVSVVLWDTDSKSKRVTFNSKEAGSNPPELVITAETASPPEPGVFTFNPNHDAFVRKDTRANDNFGSDITLKVQQDNTTLNKTRKSYLKFDLSNEGLSSITNATFRVYCETTGSFVVTAEKITNDSWNEGNITWNNCPGNGTMFDEVTMSSGGAYYEFDATAFVQEEVAGDGVVTIVLRDKTDAQLRATFNSKEAGTNKPELVITGTKVALKSAKKVGLESTQVNQQASVMVFPNPAKGYVNIQITNSNTQSGTIILYDITGQMIQQKSFKSNTGDYKLDLTGVIPGLHVLKVLFDNNIIIKKISVK